MTMSAYAYTLLTAAVAVALIELIAPKGEGGKLSSAVRMIAGLYMLVVLLHPLREGIRLLSDLTDGTLSDRMEAMLPEEELPDYQAVLGETLTHVSRQEVENWTRSFLESAYAIPPEGCSISAVCTYESEILTITEVRIALLGKYALENPHPIEAAVTQALGCPCYVTVEGRKENP